MSVVNTLARSGHFSEFNSPLVTNSGVLTPQQRKALALANLNSGATSGAGTVTTALTTSAVERVGFNGVRQTRLTLTNFDLGNGDDNAALGIGNKFYTLPAGDIMVINSWAKGLFIPAVLYINAVDAGIGTVIASGAVSVLGGTATFENIIGGTASAALAPTGGAWAATTNSVVGNGGNPNFLVASAGSHDLFLNAAGTWTNVAAAGDVVFTGTIVINWVLLS